MSYEILLYPRTPGQDWAEVLAADEADGPGLDQAGLNRGVARFRRIEAELRDLLTEPLRTWVAEDLDGDVLGQLQTRDSGLRVELYDRSASVSAPYGGPESPAHDLVRKAVLVVAAETGYEAYDPQVQTPWDGSFDEAAGQASLTEDSEQDDLWADEASGMSFAGAAVDGDGEPAEDGAETSQTPMSPREERLQQALERRRQLEEQRREPSALRRRARLNIILGVALIALGAVQIAGKQTGFLTWMLMGVGVFEFVGAWMMIKQAKTVEAQREQQAKDQQAGAQPTSGPQSGDQPTGDQAMGAPGHSTDPAGD